MKSAILLLALSFTLGAHAQSHVNIADKIDVLDAVPVASVSATANSTAVDMQQYQGQFAAVCDAANVSGTTPTMALKLQDSADNSSFADITGGGFTGITTVASVQKIALNKSEIRRYVRVVRTLGGTTPVYLLSCKILAQKKYQ